MPFTATTKEIHNSLPRTIGNGSRERPRGPGAFGTFYLFCVGIILTVFTKMVYHRDVFTRC